MPVHAILGATGSTGSAVLRCLLASEIPDLTINILVRSKSKLLAAFPQLANAPAAAVNIFEGPVSNEDALTACVQNASVIYLCVATNNSAHKVDIAFSTAARLITALGQLRKARGLEYKPPVVLFNRSLSLSTEVKLPIPGFMKNFLMWGLGVIYEDLERASLLYSLAEKDELLACITADGPMLMDAEGTEATGYELLRHGTSSWYLSYADLGTALVELGQRRQEFEGRAVGVSATGKVRTTWGSSIWIMLLGLRYRLIPF
ncbi:hypothetical protein LTR62_007156 [Meristemomyces frigidus]|uniref:NAD(P)-binding domain-containing protein n=1 Tax=Meristemomyces frigidus TaxID=1508187 RepID=A0AAN7TCI3_9PEZI|nr:hypothetical protein LTR62_007156 [Meristemomyces frigidus]